MIIALIPAILRHEYIATLELAHTDNSRFREFIADRIIATQLDLLRLLNESGGVNFPNGGVNSEFKTESGGVNTIGQQILETLRKMLGLNAPALAISLGKSLRTTQRILKILCYNGKIEFKGAPKNGGYFLLVNG